MHLAPRHSTTSVPSTAADGPQTLEKNKIGILESQGKEFQSQNHSSLSYIMADVLRVVVSGAAGQIAYALLYSIGKGDVFGPSQRLDLVLLDIQPMLPVLEGVVMELQDCSLPLVNSLIPSADAAEAFKNADAAILVGAMPRKPGMERKDLLKANAKIFQAQGKAMDANAKKDIKVLVVGNPANTNCLIAQKCAPSIPKENFSCLTRLDQNRAQAQIASRLGVPTNKVCDVTIWGNHSTTQYPDAAHAKVEKDGALVPVFDAVKDDAWLTGDFIVTVQKRGAAVLAARKLSSAMSAAKAICDHMRDWWFGTTGERWVSMGVISDGNSYGVPEGIIYSFPVRIEGKKWTIVNGLDINPFSRNKMDESAKELVSERDMAFEFLGQ